MPIASKTPVGLDANECIANAYNDNQTLAVDGFLVGKVGRKITVTASSATQDDFAFSESGSNLYTIRVTYTDSTHATFVSAERIS